MSVTADQFGKSLVTSGLVTADEVKARRTDEMANCPSLDHVQAHAEWKMPG